MWGSVLKTRATAEKTKTGERDAGHAAAPTKKIEPLFFNSRLGIDLHRRGGGARETRGDGACGHGVARLRLITRSCVVAE